MTEKWGRLIHQLEQMEMKFLRENGIIAPNYNNVENHIDKMTDLFDEEFKQNLEMNAEEIEKMIQDLDDKCDAIGSACSNLSDMKKLVNSMKKSPIKNNLMDCIERMEMDLC